MNSLLNIIATAIRMSIPLGYAAIGGSISEFSGVVALGLEGFMTIGAFTAVVGAYYLGSAWLGVLAAMIAGTLFALVFGLFCIKYKSNQIVAGVGMNIIAEGLVSVLMISIFGSKGKSAVVDALPAVNIPVIKDIPILNTLFSGYTGLAYLLFAVMVIAWIVIYKMPAGIRLRATGINDTVVDSLGLRSGMIKYVAVGVCGALSALGGAFLSLSQLNFYSKDGMGEGSDVAKFLSLTTMELIEVILSKENLNRAYKKVVANKGAGGVDGVAVEELGNYIRENREKIITSLRNRTYIPKPVRRVYIPKDNGKKRPLGIPTALDRTIQQAISQPISDIYEEIFSDYSYGFRPGRSCHDAIRQALEYLNDGYEWVVDIDIEQFFDKVNHDKLIQILREQVNDSTTLNLIRKYLKAGVMENGLEKATITGVPQGGPLSVVCSNVYLDKLDKELEHRGLRFTRYADDVLIITKSEMAANRVLKSISEWLERKLFLKVNATKTKVVRPTRSKYLGFTFLKNGREWKVKPTTEKKKKLKKKLSEYLKRGKAIARPLAVTVKRVNEMVRGWINYFRIGMMKEYMEKFGEWLRHKIRVIVMKQWKKPKTIYRNLSYLNWKNRNGFSHEEIYKVANSRLGWYKRSGMNVVNFIISKDLLENRIKDGAGLLNPLSYYLAKVGI
nr:group II intron reverse transcriptase/maturase [uncultured Mediterraneibacter sp.]